MNGRRGWGNMVKTSGPSIPPSKCHGCGAPPQYTRAPHECKYIQTNQSINPPIHTHKRTSNQSINQSNSQSINHWWGGKGGVGVCTTHLVKPMCCTPLLEIPKGQLRGQQATVKGRRHG